MKNSRGGKSTRDVASSVRSGEDNAGKKAGKTTLQLKEELAKSGKDNAGKKAGKTAAQLKEELEKNGRRAEQRR